MDKLDEEYLQSLIIKREELNSMIDKDIIFYDSTTIGDKYTTCNVGLRNRKAKNHRCPLDDRKNEDNYKYGCFYGCLGFQKGLKKVNKIKKLYDKVIKKFK